MNRRSFFGRLAAAVAGLALAPSLPTAIFDAPVAAGPVGEFVAVPCIRDEFFLSEPLLTYFRRALTAAPSDVPFLDQ